MASRAADDFRLAVLNPGGRDPEQDFRGGAGPVEQGHPPVNFHGYAACTRGSFHHDTQRAIVEKTPVFLLLRGDFRTSERALNELKKHGVTMGHEPDSVEFSTLGGIKLRSNCAIRRSWRAL